MLDVRSVDPLRVSQQNGGRRGTVRMDHTGFEPFLKRLQNWRMFSGRGVVTTNLNFEMLTLASVGQWKQEGARWIRKVE
jgi:hypothetical protein